MSVDDVTKSLCDSMETVTVCVTRSFLWMTATPSVIPWMSEALCGMPDHPPDKVIHLEDGDSLRYSMGCVRPCVDVR